MEAIKNSLQKVTGSKNVENEKYSLGPYRPVPIGIVKLSLKTQKLQPLKVLALNSSFRPR